jgi:hypothetical protein
LFTLILTLVILRVPEIIISHNYRTLQKWGVFYYSQTHSVVILNQKTYKYTKAGLSVNRWEACFLVIFIYHQKDCFFLATRNSLV